MLEMKPGKDNTGDDLDLIRLLEKLFSFGRGYGKRIVFFTVGGMLAGLALFGILPNQYSSTMLLHSSLLSNTEQINIIEDWNTLLKQGGYNVLGQRLHCDPALLKKVSAVTAAEIQKLFVPNNPNGFVVTTIVKDNNVLDSLGRGIVYGFENNDYIKAKLASKRLNLVTIIEKIKVEIRKLDSTKTAIEYSIRSENRHPSSFIFDVSTINGQLIGLNEKQLAYEDELRFTNAVQVFHPFEKFDRPVSPHLLKLLLLGAIGGFAIGYLQSMYRWLRRRMASH